MSEPTCTPLVLFKTRTNTELGAESIRVTDDGAVRLEGVLKQVTEGMLTSYPRAMLGCWTPNRAAIRYDRAEMDARDVRRFDTGESLDLAAIEALAG